MIQVLSAAPVELAPRLLPVSFSKRLIPKKPFIRQPPSGPPAPTTIPFNIFSNSRPVRGEDIVGFAAQE